MTIKRGYQGKYPFILEDLENEFTRGLTRAQVEKALFNLELIEPGELPKYCEKCPYRLKENKLPKEK